MSSHFCDFHFEYLNMWYRLREKDEKRQYIQKLKKKFVQNAYILIRREILHFPYIFCRIIMYEKYIFANENLVKRREKL